MTYEDPGIMQSPQNKTILQTFEWHTPSGPHATSHYSRLTRLLPTFANVGITSLWLPPGCKANNPQGNGYDIYDLWDLGEFQQKGARSTKWGSREELDDLIRQAKGRQMEVIWDAVLNHKQGGDGTVEAWGVEVDPEDRRYEICPPKKIEAWLRYDFSGREKESMKYSKLKWRAEHFNGVDWDQRAETHAIYKLIDDPATLSKPFEQPKRHVTAKQRPPKSRFSLLRRPVSVPIPASAPVASPNQRSGKGWAQDVDNDHGNNDYLLFSNIDYTHPETRADALSWGQWMINDVGVDGFRLDAVQHFSYTFTHEWIQHVSHASQARNGKGAFVVGEIWAGDVSRITKWLDAVQQSSGPQVYAFDAPLLYNFSRISEDIRTRSRNADLRTITRDSLLQVRPKAAVTLITNHDTQPGQTCETPMDAKLKMLWYAFILLTDQGLPCVFWGDLYGTQGPQAEEPACLLSRGKSRPVKHLLPELMLCRKLFAYGEQTSYFDSADCIGWTRSGTPEIPGSSCAVVLNIHHYPKDKRMRIGRPGELWVDALGTMRNEIKIEGDGFGSFLAGGRKASVFVRKDGVGRRELGGEFDIGAGTG